MRGMLQTECPVCHGPMEKGIRVRVSFAWEGADVEKRRWNFREQKWDVSREEGLKSVSRTMCRECAEAAASGLGIERPEEAGR